MTPYEIDILLHYYCRVDDHEDMSRTPPIWRPTIEGFIQEGVLSVGTGGREERAYSLTDRGKAYCEQLQRLKLPTAVTRWEFD